MTHQHHDMEQVTDLTEAELFVIWAARAWIAAFKGRRSICPTVRMGFRLAGVDGALNSIDGLFGILVASTRRDLDFRCMTCPGVGGDEALFLRCVAGLQYGDALASREVLTDWLPEPQIVSARQHTNDFAAALSGAKLLIPLWRLTSLPRLGESDRPRGTCSIH